jgi:phosphatidylserine/phosphatidylglycerophosphate/cardiolipin synthase-like enzyme
VEITGPAVQQLQSNILLSVIYQGGSIAPPAVVTDRSMSPKEREHSIRDFWFPRIESEGESTVKIGQSIPFQRNEVLASGRALIDKAEKTVFMHAAYFTCDKYISVLKSALERGVKVNIGVPGGFDKASSHYVWRNKVKSLLECSGAENLRVFELTKDEENGRSGYNHDKWIVVDDTLVWVSTGNPEPFSEYQGFDSSFTAKDSGLGKELQLLFEKDSLVSDRVTLDTLKNMTPSEKKQGTLYSAMLGTAGTLFSSMRDNHDIY